MAVMFLGFAGTAFNHTVQMELNPGQHGNIGPYRLTLQRLTEISNPNYDAERALIQVSRAGASSFQLTPDVRLYQASQSQDTTVADHTTPLWDLYLVYQGNDPQTNRAVIDAILNPLVVWVWIGALIMFLGSIVVIADFTLRPRAKSSTARAAVPVAVSS
jgi:cytochrome c-type biogenesis protein CcmF